MLLTPPQLKRFWSKQEGWPAVVKARGWDAAEAELQRKSMLRRAGFTSLTLVDKLTGFDRVLSELAALSRPDDLAPQLRAAEMPRTRLIYACRQLADEPYIVALAASDRFKCHDWPAMPLDTMLHLRNTLADRAVGQHRPTTLAQRHQFSRQRRAVPNPKSRLKFPDLPANSIATEVPEPECVAGPF